MPKKKAEKKKKTAKVDIAKIAHQKRHIHLITKMQSGTALTEREIMELKKYELAKEGNTNIVTTMVALGKALGVNRKTVQRAKHEEGMPVESDGTYDIKKIKEWWNRERGTSKGGDLKRAKMQAEIDKILFDLEVKRGAWMKRADVVEAVVVMARTLNSLLDGIPNRLAPIIAVETDPRKCKKMIADEINNAKSIIERGNITDDRTPA